jgi:hypothetical protein
MFQITMFRSLVLAFLPTVVLSVDPLVTLDYTSYQGTALPNGISQWLGVRYAAPPLGSLRFSAPQDPVANSTVQIADHVSPKSSFVNG